MHDPESYPFPGWWNKMESKAKEMSDAALLWSARDAREAADCRNSNECRYLDEMHIFLTEMHRRRSRA